MKPKQTQNYRLFEANKAQKAVDMEYVDLSQENTYYSDYKYIIY